MPLTLSQPKRGYRFSTDALMLADRVTADHSKTLLDAGCGCGVIAILLAQKFPHLSVTAVEIQKELADCARKNITDLGLLNRIRLLHQDIRALDPPPGLFDLMVSNPPYKKRGTGRINPDSCRAAARHEILLTIDQLFTQARRLLRPGGRLYLIFPEERLPDLDNAMQASGFSRSAMERINTGLKGTSKRVILNCRRSRR